MKIDLEKELGLNSSQNTGSSLWLKIIACFCVLNFFVVIFLFIAVLNKNNNSEIIKKNNLLVNRLAAKLNNIERMQKQLRSAQKKSTKELTVVTAAKKIEQKRKRMQQKKIKKSGVDNEKFNALGSTVLNKKINLPQEEKNKLDDIIDRDESGEQLKAYIRALKSPAHKKAVIAYLKQKGNQWFKATLPLIADDDLDVDIYIDNTKYFFNIIRDTSDNSADIAYAGSKLSQLEIAIQKAEFRKIAEEERLNRQEEIENLKEDLAPIETAEQAQERIQSERRKNSIIKPYKSSKLTHPYNSDWDPDPRVREERGIE